MFFRQKPSGPYRYALQIVDNLTENVWRGIRQKLRRLFEQLQRIHKRRAGPEKKRRAKAGCPVAAVASTAADAARRAGSS